MTHVTCRLTAKNRDQLRDPIGFHTLGNRVWAAFTFTHLLTVPISTLYTTFCGSVTNYILLTYTYFIHVTKVNVRTY